nr:zinc finger BED domain-containing protein RICESLEEPER 2-like [Tanacetum cinerariifolium]
MFPVLSRMAMDLISIQASSVAYESAFSTSGKVLSIQRTRLTSASLEMCMCLKDHLDAKEPIPQSDEEIALDASSEGTLSPGGPRIPLLYQGEYSQWVERFMNYLEEQTDEEAMINSIKNGDQPLPRVTQVSIAGTTSTEQPPLKDKSMWSDQEK